MPLAAEAEKDGVSDCRPEARMLLCRSQCARSRDPRAVRLQRRSCRSRRLAQLGFHMSNQTFRLVQRLPLGTLLRHLQIAVWSQGPTSMRAFPDCAHAPDRGETEQA